MVSGARRGVTSDVQLSPYLNTSTLPPIVDTMRTTWPVNPFGALPGDSAALGAVMEFSLLSPGTGAGLRLPNVSAASNSMPVHFRIPVGEWAVVAVLWLPLSVVMAQKTFWIPGSV